MSRKYFERRENRGRDQGKAMARVSGLGLALLLLSIAISLATVACNWELNVYRTLSVAQVSYQKYFEAVVQLHDGGAISDVTFEKAKFITSRIAVIGKNTTGLLISYRNVQDAVIKRQIDAAVLEIPALVAELATIAQAVVPKSQTLGTGDQDVAWFDAGAKFEKESQDRLQRLDWALQKVEALQ